MTRIWRVDPEHPSAEAIEEAAALLRRGELVAFPTETVYGLGADGLDGEAVRGIFRAKGRPLDNPLILHVADVAQIEPLLADGVPRERLDRLAERFWPGPLTLVLPRSPQIPGEVTAGLDTVAVRIPAHPVALALLDAVGRPVAAPSANRSGRPSPTRAEHVEHDLGGKIAGIVDGGPCTVGLESTVLDLSQGVPTILRPGGIDAATLADALGCEVRVDPQADRGVAHPAEQAVRSPGMKYRHYAPSVPLRIVEWPNATPERLVQVAAEWREVEPCSPGTDVSTPHGCIGLLVTDEAAEALHRAGSSPFPVRSMGPGDRPERIAKELFHTLRSLDDWGVERVVVEGVRPEGIGFAVMNRLRRAAAPDEPSPDATVEGGQGELG